MRIILFFLGLLFPPPFPSQSVWSIHSRGENQIKIDGYLEDWPDGPALTLAPGAVDLDSEGDFQGSDVGLTLRGLWDKNSFYLAMRWEDDQWDIHPINRSEATWMTPDRRRRDRMLFYDFFKFQIRKSNYDYTLWLSPRIKSKGPFLWERLLKGAKGMETVTRPPLVTSREQHQYVTMEVMFQWKELDLKPKEGLQIPLFLNLSDSDKPGFPLESKVDLLKWLRWRGTLLLNR